MVNYKLLVFKLNNTYVPSPLFAASNSNCATIVLRSDFLLWCRPKIFGRLSSSFRETGSSTSSVWNYIIACYIMGGPPKPFTNLCTQFTPPESHFFAKEHKITFVGVTIGFQTKKNLSKLEHFPWFYRALK